jgi:hypothetical protein
MTRSRRRHEASFVFAINPSNSLFVQRNSTRIENLRAKTAKFNSQHCARTSQIAQVLARGFYLEGVLLQHTPDSVGESRAAGRRILIVPQLAVIYRVLPDDRLGKSATSARLGRRKNENTSARVSIRSQTGSDTIGEWPS